MTVMPTFAQMVHIHDLRARGMNAEAIAARLSLDVALVREILNPKPTTSPQETWP
ncbi:hypothetical protein [Thiomonas sp.]|uniref:hypothetical protein n=1 Tax=Thiomonas sp. TaxID=2047785 RepID=UPI00258F2D80|nr:hypothetical protein [Thiomonas sp.]